jgi:hypothetical protein
MAATELPYDARAALRRMRVGVHLHDRGTLWNENSATIKAGDLCRWFKRTFIDEGLADALAPSPYTNPAGYRRFSRHDLEMETLDNHRLSLADRAFELGIPVFSSVEAQIVPVDEPQDESATSLAYVLDLPDPVAAAHDVVFASVHAQPPNTEKDLDHVKAMRYAALANPYVAWLSHIDRYVNFLPFPDLEFFKLAAAANTGYGINENYLATKAGVLGPGCPPIRPSWGHLLDGDRPLTPQEFVQFIENRDDLLSAQYHDYRQSHLIALAVRAGCPLVVEFDWHLPTSPDGIDLEAGELGPWATVRLERFGRFLDLRFREFEGEYLVVTSSLERFNTFRLLRHSAE